MATSESYHAYLIESLQDPQEAAAYLDAVLEDGNFEEFQLALTYVLEARPADGGQMPPLQNHLDVPTLLQMLNRLGFKLSVVTKERTA